MIDRMRSGQKGAECPDNPELVAPGLGIHIGFSTTGSWVSRMIRKITAAPVSHCFVVYHSEAFGKDMVLEASGRGFRMLAWSRFDVENRLIAIYRVELPEPALKDALGRLAGRLGDAYDTLSLFGFLLRKWFRLKRTPFDSREKLICSEAVALFLEWAGLEFEDVGVVTPRDLLELAQSQTEVFRLIEQGESFGKVAAKVARSCERKQRRRGARIAAVSEESESTSAPVG
jgi:hypothetical protein